MPNCQPRLASLGNNLFIHNVTKALIPQTKAGMSTESLKQCFSTFLMLRPLNTVPAIGDPPHRKLTSVATP